MKKFFVYGGCVSRDIFNEEYNSNLILSDYVARYSLAKLDSNPASITISKDKVPSNFQRRLLEIESKNLLLTMVDNSDFDFFLMDLMFLRYRLICYKDSTLTYSAEFKKTGLVHSSYKVITNKEGVFWEKFKIGLDLLLRKLSDINKLDAIIVNKLFLADKIDHGGSFDNLDYIEQQNTVLSTAYDILEKFLKPSQFLTYDDDFFVANSNHRWGLNPMHYIDDFYQESHNKLSIL